MTIVKTKLFVFVLGLVLTLTSTVSAQNFSGQWLGTVSESVNRCERLGKAEPGDYKLTIVHKDGDIMIMENVRQVPYKGVIKPNPPHSVFVQGAYEDDGGYVTELLEIEFVNESEGRGHSVWSWSDGYYQCGGRFNFTLKKIRD